MSYTKNTKTLIGSGCRSDVNDHRRDANDCRCDVNDRRRDANDCRCDVNDRRRDVITVEAMEMIVEMMEIVIEKRT